ncbi:hypothetical protein ABVK25_012232 [Lepraria finkii]|uniref:Uncharacterized protein n=1 Tax=Lepraria finkii TaxID=1340010 RepID=A0ABR4AH43_9LECA
MEIQREHDATAPVQDILAQLEGNHKSVNSVLPTLGPIQYAFEERARIAKAFFDPPSTTTTEAILEWRISIAEDMVSLCSRQEGIFRKARQMRRIRPDDIEAGSNQTIIKTEPDSDSDSECSLPPSFPLRCKPYQCFYCLSKVGLPMEERRHNLGSKSSLQRHFDRWHPLFQPGRPCPFPHQDSARFTINSVMEFNVHAVKVHGICMLDKGRHALSGSLAVGIPDSSDERIIGNT